MQLLLIAAIAGAAALSGVRLDAAGWVVGIACGGVTNLALAHGLVHYRANRMSPADWVTLARATLAVGLAALVAASFGQHVQVTILLSLATLALALDAVDGWVARRTRTEGLLGARFDGEVDAFLIFVLSVYVARAAGAWVLAIGAARYGFLAAGWPLSWMRATLPPRPWRKLVCATQGVVLVIVVADVLPLVLARLALVGALVLLAESFGRDVWWLWGHRNAAHSRLRPGADAMLELAVARPASPERSRVRVSIAAIVTVLAVLVVWAALVAPDQPGNLTITAFLRLPVEGLVLIVLAVVLPATARRVVAGFVGPALGLLVILKILDISFFAAFARPFDLVGDAGNAGIGIETLRAALGHTEANLILFGGVTLAIALLTATTLALFRLMRVAAGNRRWSLAAAAALGTVWLLSSASGAQFLSHTPIASSSTAGYVVHELRTVQADIHDEGAFANQIRHDPFSTIPGSRLLTGLRGKDVLLVFVESYGQVSVQGSSFSPAIDAVLTKGGRQLRDAGFSARSAFVAAPGFGGISWLAHSSLQTGAWANSQRRYDQLIGTHRLTLSGAFERAGWRTINFAPADDRSWPEGSSFYHYNKLYDRRDMGYRGPSFNYAPMPDQYMYAALRRLELAKPHRPSLFAEVDTVSSHMPWDRIPRMVPWNHVGNGAVFNRLPVDREPPSFWWHPTQVKAAYARSLEYSLNALISFVQRYGRKNLALVVVGDEQPLAIVSGQGASHDVPISVIAHDPSVFKRIGRWDWSSGLLPSPHAPVWPMSAFRDRFLTAFGPGR
ncbi:MAG TPA: CDP-alcohol phosphatidyltransferase family protein [Solirubrobacteraceae bacterium]|nr:CDP-alcohol phosphatidyltransferase family protein [Solirubrobacteraceae bacterium]